MPIERSTWPSPSDNSLLAPKANPVFTGVVTLPSMGGTTTSEAVTAYEQNALPGAMELTGWKFATFPRAGIGFSNQTTVGATGILVLAGIYLPIGTVVNNVIFHTGGTAAVTPTHSWMVLCDNTRIILAQSTDKLTAAIASGVPISYAMNPAFTVTYSGLHYIGFMQTAATCASHTGPSSTGTPVQSAPILVGRSNTGCTGLLGVSTTCTAITADTGAQIYGGVS